MPWLLSHNDMYILEWSNSFELIVIKVKYDNKSDVL